MANVLFWVFVGACFLAPLVSVFFWPSEGER